MKDPLTLTQETLEAYFKSAPALRRAFGGSSIDKRIIGYTGPRGTEANDVAAENDLPELRLEAVGGPCNVNFASNLSNMDWSWRLLLNTGDQRITYRLTSVVFAVYAAIAHAIDSSLDGRLVGLKWGKEFASLPEMASYQDGYPFAKNLDFSNVQAAQSDPQANRGIKGWSALCDLTVHMIFPTALLREFNRANL